MKFTLIVFLSFNLCVFSQSRAILPTTLIFTDGQSTILTTDSICFDQIMYRNDDNERMYLIDLIPCKGGKKLKGDLVAVLQKWETVLYVPFNSLESYYFNYSNNEILESFKSFDQEQKESFRSHSSKRCLSYYQEMFEEQERLRIEAELLQKRKEQEERERWEKEVYLSNLSKVRVDSTMAVMENNRLVQEYKPSTMSDETKRIFSDLIYKGKNNGGILITVFDVYSDYSTGIKLEIFNCLNKRIKYIHFTVRAYNPVDDPIGSTEILKGIGWVEPNSTGSWTFDNIWYSELIEKAKISSIKLFFEDGSTKVISDISKIRCDYNLDDGATVGQALELYQLLMKVDTNRTKTTIIGTIKLNSSKETLTLDFKDLHTNLVHTIYPDRSFLNELNLIIEDFYTTSLLYSVRDHFYTTEYNKNIYLRVGTGETVLQINELIKLRDYLATKL